MLSPITATPQNTYTASNYTPGFKGASPVEEVYANRSHVKLLMPSGIPIVIPFVGLDVII